MAAFFGRNGYSTRTNVVLPGRTGGSHEIDVLAEKADALTTFRVAIECKAWRQPIEKDVVTKLNYVMGDVGLHKGIVVALSGCRSGAERAAVELGIELWGPDELRRHLGENVFKSLDVDPRPSNLTIAWGRPFSIPVPAAERAIRSVGKGRLGRVHEKLLDIAALWVPAYSVRITCAVPERTRRKVVHKSVTFDNLYEALTGNYIGRAPESWVEVSIEQGTALPPSHREAKLQAALRKAFDGYSRVSSAAAVARHSATLADLGLPAPCGSLSVDGSGLVYLPYVAGVLESKGGQRVVAVHGETGAVANRVSRILTAELSLLRAHLQSHNQPTPP
jgi:hypothetical protein